MFLIFYLTLTKVLSALDDSNMSVFKRKTKGVISEMPYKKKPFVVKTFTSAFFLNIFLSLTDIIIESFKLIG